MKSEIQKIIRDTFKKLNEVLSSVPSGKIDQVPFEGSWTAGQVVEHIIKAIEGTPKLFKGKTEKANRPQDEKVEAIKKMFLDFTTKMKSPDFILPVEEVHDKAEQISMLHEIEKEFLNAAETNDLTELCLDFEIQGFGPFTKYEWLSFAMIHTQRHTHQLENISRKL